MNFSGFRRLVVDAMAQCHDPAFLAAWLRQSWRLNQVRFARAMAAIRDLACVKDRAAVLMQLPPDALRHAPRWIALTGLSDEFKIVVLRELTRSGHDVVRRAALDVLGTQPLNRSLSPLRALAGSEDADVAALARLHLARSRPAEISLRDLLSQVMGQPVAPKRTPPPEDQLSFDAYWVSFDEMPADERRSRGQQILKRLPLASAIIGKKLADPEPCNRIRALRITALLGLAEHFSEQLYQLSFDPDADVRSAAIAALSHLSTPTSRRIVRGALNDEDQRVRANAVEAVEKVGGSSVADKLLPMLTSKDNRVRANAVKALLKLGVRQAAETLLRMLHDKNRAHRISALWLIENMGLFSLATRIVTMAEADEDEQVRDRAQRLADRLGAESTEAEAQEVAT
jgi:HEAT repeat protein